MTSKDMTVDYDLCSPRRQQPTRPKPGDRDPDAATTMDISRRLRQQRDRDAAMKRRKTMRSRGAAHDRIQHNHAQQPSQDKLSHPPALPELPTELVLEIVDRCNPATLIVCAATCRLLHRHILSQAFITKLRRRFAASSLLGFFYRHYKKEPSSRPPPFTPTSGVVRSPFAPGDVFNNYTPVESRGGLLVLRDSALFTEHARLCVYDPITGRRVFLPPPEVHQQSYALLVSLDNHGGDCAGAMFLRLIVVDLSLLRFHYTVRAQTFSPDNNGAWGPVVEAPTPDILHHHPDLAVARASPVIIGAILHWLCTDHRTILTFNSDTSEVGAVQIPYHHCICQNIYHIEQQLLASSAEGELRMLVVQRLVISVWVLQTTTPEAEEWARRAAVDLQKIVTVPAQLLLPEQYGRLHNKVRLQWAGNMSGAVVAEVAGVGLVVLYLDAEEVVCRVTVSANRKEGINGLPFRYCPYERDLVARLAAVTRQ